MYHFYLALRLSFFSSKQLKKNLGLSNPVALIKAKIVCNFGLSECNRVMNGKMHLPAELILDSFTFVWVISLEGACVGEGIITFQINTGYAFPEKYCISGESHLQRLENKTMTKP